MRWQAPNRHPRARARRLFVARTATLKLRHRIDGVLIGGVVGVLAALAVGLFVLVQVAQRMDLLDPRLVQPLADERILTNVRDDLAARPLLDAVYHAADGRVYLAQSGGVLHRYDPRTRLWSEEIPFQDNAEIDPNLAMLRSGCGDERGTPGADLCSDQDSLWAVSASGGLARRNATGWQVIIGNTRFLGASGTAVEETQLSAAAVSEDQRWLVLGTHGDGIGIYDIDRGSWRSLPAELFAALPDLTITHLIFWQDRFWIGTPAGLTSLEIDNSGQRLLDVPNSAGTVLDLDAEDSLWLLRTQPCLTGGNTCRWIGRYDTPNSEPAVLFDERHEYPNLNLADLSFAQQWGDQLVVAGHAGIFLYDTIRHDWQQIETRRVEITLGRPAQDGFYFGYAGGVGLLVHGQTQPGLYWDLPGQRIAQLVGAGSEILALTDAGNLYTLEATGEVSPLYEVTTTAFDPTAFTAAVAVGDTVIFRGPEGVLLHDVRYRRYQDIAASALADWFLAAETQLIDTPAILYAVTADSDRAVSVYRLDRTRLNDAATFQDEVNNAQPESINGPVTSLWPWANSLGLIAGGGRLYRVTPTAVEPLTGPAETELDDLPILDAVIYQGDLTISTSQGMRTYDLDSRAWNSFSAPSADERAEELAVFADTLLLRSDAGRLIRQSSNNSLLIGDETGFDISDGALSDALLQDKDLYLAGGGRIERYDLERRRITQRWQPTTDSVDLSLEAVVQGEPLTLAGGVAYLGDDEIDRTAGAVTSLSVGDGRIWTVREAANGRYLKSYQTTSLTNTQCFFRTPTARGAGAILDARLLSNGLIAAMTDAGIFFYRLDARTWYPTAFDQNIGRGRLYLLGDFLVVTSEEGTTTTVLTTRLDFISVPHSCNTTAIALDAETYVVSALAVDEARSRMAWLAPDGSVSEWRNGAVTPLLAATSPGPETAALRRLFARGDDLLFTTANQIWHYDLTRRTWRNIRLENAPTAIADINIEVDGSRQIVSVRGADGSAYVGSFLLTESRVAVSAVGQAAPGWQGSASSLLDAQAGGDGLWRLLAQDRVQYFDPASRTWRASGVLGAPDPTLSYQEALGRGVVVGNSGQRWWIAQSTASAPAQFVPYDLEAADTQTALDAGGVVWRLDNNGRLHRCTADTATNTYACTIQDPSPFILDPNTVRSAVQWQDLHLVELDTGLRVYNAALRREVALPTETQIAGLRQVRIFDDRIWLWNGTTLITARQEQESLAGDRLDGVDQFVFDATGVPWMHTADGWQVWQERRFQWPRVENEERPDLTVFVVEGGAPTALDAAGFAYAWRNGQFVADPLPLPPEITSAEIRGLWSTPGRNWWVQLGPDQLVSVVRSACLPVAAAPLTTPVIITPTQEISPTGSVTETQPLLLPTATPEPQPVPCLAVRERLTGLPLTTPDQIVAVDPQDESLRLDHANGERLTVDLTRPADERVAWTTQQPITPVNLRLDQWPELRANLVQRADSQWAYDGQRALRVAGGALVVERPLSVEQVAERGVLNFTQPPALDATWLRWDRPRRQFEIATPAGPIFLNSDEMIQDGQMLFEAVDAVLATAMDAINVANRHGVWRYAHPDLRLTDTTILFQPLSLQLPISGVHGAFRAANGDFVLGGTGVQPPQNDHQVTFGDVTLTENLRSGGVVGRYWLGNANPSVFSSQGFVWDEGRRGVALNGQDLYLQSLAGIQRADGFQDFDPGPAALTLGETLLASEQAGPLHLLAPNNVYRLDSNGWQANVPNPADTRQLLADAAWRWRMDAGQFQVVLNGQPYGFGFGVQGNGFGFLSDQMQAAAWHNALLFVVTDAFLEVGSQDAIAQMNALRQAAQPSDRLDPISVQGQETLVRTAGSAVSRWQPRSGQFEPMAALDDPYRLRTLVDTGRLRLTLRDGDVVKEVNVDDLSGNRQWVVFTFQDDQFPFDVVNSVAADERGLYVGTAAGLLVYPDLRSFHLNSAVAFYDLSGTSPGSTPSTPSTALAAVERVGVPVDRPDLLMARSAVACIERSRGGFVTCTDPSLLDRRLRVDTSFWQWTQDRTGVVSGFYRAATGQLTSTTTAIERGRFPHDWLRQGIVCADDFYALWETDWQSLHSSGAARLNGGVRHDDLATVDPDRLFCLRQALTRTAVTLQPGIYLQRQDRRFSQWQGSQWQPIADPIRQLALRHVADHPPIYERARLSLEEPEAGEPFIFAQQTLNRGWQTLAWQEGRLTVDHWRALLWTGTQLWAASHEGILPIGIVNSRMQIDPDALLIVREPAPEGDRCLVSDLAADGAQVVARCEASSDFVFAGTLQVGNDQANFQPVDIDPFAETDLIQRAENGYWQWRREGRINGEAGRLTATLRDETLKLAVGRFAFDAPSSLAVNSTGGVEWISDGGGWYTLDERSAEVANFARPKHPEIAPAEVSAVAWTRSDDGFWLCLRIGDSYTRLSQDGDIVQTPTCPAYRGQDSLWRYVWNETTLEMTALRSVGGVGGRRLQGGAFGDNSVLGPPVTGRDESGIFYLLPTRAGVLRLNATLRADLIHVPPFPGLPENSVPSALLMLVDSQMPIYAGIGQLWHLDETRNSVANQPIWQAAQPPTTASFNTTGNIQLTWRQPDGRRWALLGESNDNRSSTNALAFDVTSLDTYFASRAAGYALSGWLWLRVEPNRLQVWEAGVDKEYAAPLAESSAVVAAIPLADRLLLIYERELWDISVDEALERIIE